MNKDQEFAEFLRHASSDALRRALGDLRYDSRDGCYPRGYIPKLDGYVRSRAWLIEDRLQVKRERGES